METLFGRATVADVDALVRLRLAYLSEDFGELSEEQRAPLPAEIASYLEAHLGSDLQVFVARDADEGIVCCAWLLLVEKPPSPRFPHGRTGTLFNVYTVASHRRQGLASQVMGMLIDEASAHKLDLLELNATEDGYPLYRSLGFRNAHERHRAMRYWL